MNVAIIPARGGSKRIPRKNIREFRGQPMIAYAICAAKKSGLFDHIVVSTDDDEIATIAESFGAEVPFRRDSELANDHAGTLAVIQDAIRQIGLTDACVTAIYPTVPTLKAEDLNSAYEFWNQNSQVGFLVPACRYAYPVFRSFVHEAPNGLKMLFPNCYHERSQDLPIVYHDAAMFYIAKSTHWLASERIYQNDSLIYEMPMNSVCDIDTPDDWNRAELLIEWNNYNMSLVKA